MWLVSCWLWLAQTEIPFGFCQQTYLFKMVSLEKKYYCAVVVSWSEVINGRLLLWSPKKVVTYVPLCKVVPEGLSCCGDIMWRHLVKYTETRWSCGVTVNKDSILYYSIRFYRDVCHLELNREFLINSSSWIWIRVAKIRRITKFKFVCKKV